MKTWRVWMLSGVMLLAGRGRAWSYAEDVGSDNHSAAHYDLTRALLRCYGFGVTRSDQIADADQATDTAAYGTVSFSFTDRSGTNGEYFHFSEYAGSLDRIAAWAHGVGTLALPGGNCDSAGTCWDNPDFSGNSVKAGSPHAVGIWLHALADWWSHHACVANGGESHLVYNHLDPAEDVFCDFDMHDHEWGSGIVYAPLYVQLADNALSGLRAVRDAIAALAAAQGRTTCNPVTDAQLAEFAAAATPSARVSNAQSIYDACAVCP